MTTRAEIVAAARSWIHTPFHHQASCKGFGVDCIGLLRGVGRECNIEGSAELETAAEFQAYGADPNPALLISGAERFMDRIERSDLQLADVLLFKTRYSKGMPKHFGLISRVDPFYMIHAWAPGAGRVTENRVDATWWGRILACYRFRGID